MFERLFEVIRGMLRRFVSGVEAEHPEALLENEKENLRVQVARFNEGLVSHAALCERLIEQVQRLENEREGLHQRITAHLKAGNREPAAELALMHQKVQRELAENRKQAETAETTYRDLVSSRDSAIEAARRKIEQLRRGIDEMRIQQAMAELNQMAAGLITSVGGTGETLSRLEELVSDQRSRAAGVSRVSREQLELGDLARYEQEQDALAAQALADFAAREGISLEAAATNDSGAGGIHDATTKLMGPGESEG